jgi:hypothetical protein
MPAPVEHEAAQEGHTVGRLIIFAMLIHRHRLVGIRTRVKNGLQHLMLNRRVQLKQKLWSEAGQKVIREPPLEGWAGQRRQDLLTLLSGLNPQDCAVGASRRACCAPAPASLSAPDATRGRSHPRHWPM